MPLVRRELLKRTLLAAIGLFGSLGASSRRSLAVDYLVDGFERADSSALGEQWEGLNLGFWRLRGNRLRRCLRPRGHRARATGFPFHYVNSTEPNGQLTRKYDPSHPLFIMWNRTLKLRASFRLKISATVEALTGSPRPDDDAAWRMYEPGFGFLGIALGGRSQFESYYPSDRASPFVAVKEDGTFGVMRHVSRKRDEPGYLKVVKAPALCQGDRIEIVASVYDGRLGAELLLNGEGVASVDWKLDMAPEGGYFGIAARGLLDVAVTSVHGSRDGLDRLDSPLNECHVSYALGDTLQETDAGWTVRFVAIFRSDGEVAGIRVSEYEHPPGGWERVAIAGSGAIVTNEFRSNTAIIDALLPANPADATLYFTIWKDGVDVTSDVRIGTDSTGMGTGLVGDVPADGGYVGRLPKLNAPYRIAGLSCHAIITASKASLPGSGEAFEILEGEIVRPVHEPFFVHDQPCFRAFQHLESHDFQILLWEDDIWYLEMPIYPPSVQDAYKIITTTIAGPTTRWQMMRHWNVMNPGDHDYGMDDVKGPEQFVLRQRDDLGQARDYLARNFQIVAHLTSGIEDPSGVTNPRRWRRWRMPNRDFALLILDSRLWRTSQDTAIWVDEGWGLDKTLYSRKDPTRVLLGEEQFAWLSETLRTEPAKLVCLTGLNALHTVWGGHDGRQWVGELLERDRVSADYAGWVKAGADRVLEAISSRGGVVSVYGDVHAGLIIRNRQKRIYEASFGPIGRWGGRTLAKGFGREMEDLDGRPIECISLYHHAYENVDLRPRQDINYWNLLQAEFDPRPDDPVVYLALRNITDRPADPPRGGGYVSAVASEMGRPSSAFLPDIKTLADADILVIDENGAPILGWRSDADGALPRLGLPDREVGESVVVIAKRDSQVRSHAVVLETNSEQPIGAMT